MRDDFERIRNDIKVLGKRLNIKFSMVTDHYNSFTVSVMTAPEKLLAGLDGYAQVNHYYIESSEYLTEYGKMVCNEVNEIIKKEHWDKSDIQSDYFHCAFYYHIHIGKWGKPFELKGAKP